MHIGYATLEDWLAEYHKVDWMRAIYAISSYETKVIGGYGIKQITGVIVIATPDLYGRVNYCRIPVGNIDYLGVLEEDEDAMRQYKEMERAWKIVHAYGRAGCLAYDHDTKTWSRSQPEPPQNP